MRSKGEEVRTLVPPGPDNPLGRYRLRLSLDCCGIHSTNAPQSIYRFQTHGCIRLAPAHAKELFSRVAVRLPVEIIYEPVLIARGEDGTIYLEVHPDIYGDSRDQTATADAIAYGRGFLSARESPLWKNAIQRQEGIAVSLTLSGERLVENDREALPKETFPGERRVAMVPAVIPSLNKIGLDVVVERGAGEPAGFPDAA